MSLQSAEKLDNRKSEDFVAKMTEILNHGAICLMLSIGHRCGLFELMRNCGPVTAKKLSEQASLNERYVREWLDALVVGGIIEYTADKALYCLPEAHAIHLTGPQSALSDDGSMNLAVSSQFVSMLGGVEDEILDCFRNGGGLDYSRFGRFHEIMAEESAQTVTPWLVEKILPLDSGLIARLESGIRVADIGCGRGRAIMAMAERFPRSSFTGFDLCLDAIQHARAEMAARGPELANLQFLCADATELGHAESFDLITAFDAIHDQAFPARVLENIRCALSRGGVFLMQDIDVSSHLQNNIDSPLAPFIYTVSCLHCMTVSLARGGDGLGAAWGRELAVSMLSDAGFENVEVYNLAHDPLNCYYLARATD